MPSWRAVWLCGPTGVPGAGGLGCGAGLLCVPVGGGPPASRPRCELRSARRLEARPGPATTHGHRSLAHRSLRGALHTGGAGSLMCALRVDSLSGQALPPPTGTAARPTSPSGALHTSGVWSLIVARRVVSKPGQALPPPINFARNSPAACSSFEYISLELQRFWGVSKNDHDKLRAKFGRRWCRCCPRTLRAGPWILRSRRASRDTTEAGPRRIPPLVACGGRAVCADKPAPETQCPSLSSVTTVAVASGANAQFFHQPLTVSTAWAPRSVSAEWALTRPEDRRAAWKREATFSQFTRFHQALT